MQYQIGFVPEAAICGAALYGDAAAFAAEANADTGTDWLTSLTSTVDDWMSGLTSATASTSASGASTIAASLATTDDGTDFLSGSTHALILGPTGIPTPNSAYIAGESGSAT